MMRCQCSHQDTALHNDHLKDYTVNCHLMTQSDTISLTQLIIGGLICDRACENRACGHKLHPIILLVISHYWKSIFPFCDLHHYANEMLTKC